MDHRDEILKANQDRIDHIFNSFLEADELEKARTIHMIGEIKTFGGREYIKTPTGWKYHGKGTGAMAQSHVAGAAEHNTSRSTPSTSNASRDLMKPREGKTYEVGKRGWGESATHELGATDGSHQVDMQFSSPEEANKFATKHGFPMKEGLPKIGSTVQIDSSGAMTTQMRSLAGKDLKVVGHEDSNLISEPKQLLVEDSEGNRTSISPSHVKSTSSAAPKYGQKGYSPASKEQLTADVKENYKRSSLAIQNQKVAEAVAKHFPETATTSAKSTSTSEPVFNTATTPGGTKIPARGIGGNRSDMIEVPSIQTLAKTPIDNAVKTAMNQLSIAGRTQYLNQAEASIENDKKKARGYNKLTPIQHDEGLRVIENLRRQYVGTTTTEQGNVRMSINPKGEASINGKTIQVDSDSGFVKLGGGGRSSSTGGMYGAGHFDGQLQGSSYVACTQSIIGAIQGGKSIKDAISHVKQNSSTSIQEAFPKVLAHLGLDNL